MPETLRLPAAPPIVRFRNSHLSSLYAFVLLDGAGYPAGVVRRDTPIGTQPMIADHPERLIAFRPEAIEAAAAIGLRLRAFDYAFHADITAIVMGMD